MIYIFFFVFCASVKKNRIFVVCLVFQFFNIKMVVGSFSFTLYSNNMTHKRKKKKADFLLTTKKREHFYNTHFAEHIFFAASQSFLCMTFSPFFFFSVVTQEHKQKFILFYFL